MGGSPTRKDVRCEQRLDGLARAVRREGSSLRPIGAHFPGCFRGRRGSTARSGQPPHLPAPDPSSIGLTLPDTSIAGGIPHRVCGLRRCRQVGWHAADAADGGVGRRARIRPCFGGRARARLRAAGTSARRRGQASRCRRGRAGRRDRPAREHGRHDPRAARGAPPAARRAQRRRAGAADGVAAARGPPGRARHRQVGRDGARDLAAVGRVGRRREADGGRERRKRLEERLTRVSGAMAQVSNALAQILLMLIDNSEAEAPPPPPPRAAAAEYDPANPSIGARGGGGGGGGFGGGGSTAAAAAAAMAAAAAARRPPISLGQGGRRAARELQRGGRDHRPQRRDARTASRGVGREGLCSQGRHRAASAASWCVGDSPQVEAAERQVSEILDEAARKGRTLSHAENRAVATPDGRRTTLLVYLVERAARAEAAARVGGAVRIGRHLRGERERPARRRRRCRTPRRCRARAHRLCPCAPLGPP